MITRVTLPNLFQGHLLGGLSKTEFELMTESERLAARLNFIATRAEVLAELPYDEDNKMPANVHAAARKIRDDAKKALDLLDANSDIHKAMLFSLNVGYGVQYIQTILATAAALDMTKKLQRPRSVGGNETAKIRQQEAATQQGKAAELWEKLAAEGRPEHQRTNIIAKRMQVKPDTVRRWIKKAGLR